MDQRTSDEVETLIATLRGGHTGTVQEADRVLRRLEILSGDPSLSAKVMQGAADSFGGSERRAVRLAPSRG